MLPTLPEVTSSLSMEALLGPYRGVLIFRTITDATRLKENSNRSLLPIRTELLKISTTRIAAMIRTLTIIVTLRREILRTTTNYIRAKLVARTHRRPKAVSNQVAASMKVAYRPLQQTLVSKHTRRAQAQLRKYHSDKSR